MKKKYATTGYGDKGILGRGWNGFDDEDMRTLTKCQKKEKVRFDWEHPLLILAIGTSVAAFWVWLIYKVMGLIIGLRW